MKVLNSSLTFALFLLCAAHAQDKKAQTTLGGMTNMDMFPQSMSPANSAAQDMPGMGSGEGSAHAMHAMDGHHMDVGPHMKMTALRSPQPGDKQKAEEVVETARKVLQKYKGYKVALADGFKIFLPNLPQRQYHFTNYSYAFEAGMHFNPEHPTSSLYKKNDNGYKLIGLMYTAPKKASEDELNSRIPLSIAQWHAHINLCMPPADKKSEALGPNAKFGLGGSIASKDACDCRERKVYRTNLRMDGARLPIRAKAGRHMVCGAASAPPYGLSEIRFANEPFGAVGSPRRACRIAT